MQSAFRTHGSSEKTDAKTRGQYAYCQRFYECNGPGVANVLLTNAEGCSRVPCLKAGQKGGE